MLELNFVVLSTGLGFSTSFSFSFFFFDFLHVQKFVVVKGARKYHTQTDYCCMDTPQMVNSMTL